MGNTIGLSYSFKCPKIAELLGMVNGKNGNCKEELPKKPVGRLLAVCRPTVGRQTADSFCPKYRLPVGRQSADCW